MSRGQRTSRIWIVLRAGLAIYAIIAAPFTLIWLLTGVALFLDWPSLVGVIAGVAILMLIGSVGTRIGAWLLLGDDPEYWQWRRDGFDPYFDNLPPPLNNDSWSVRLTGREELTTEWNPNEASYTDVNGLATLPCPSCQQQVKEPWIACFIEPGVACWHCGKTMRLCPGCANIVGEPVVGGFNQPQGVRCPFCEVVMQ